MSVTDFPHHLCPKHYKCKCLKHVVEEDSRLVNWRKWMKMRKEMYEKIAMATKRRQCEVLMNAHEKLREFKEDQMVVQYLEIPNPQDRYRGNPAFWKCPTALHQMDLCQTYYTTMTKEEKYLIPDIEYVKVPEVVGVEKHVETRRKANWGNAHYLWYRLHDENVPLIQPHKPDIANMMIVGNRLMEIPIPKPISRQTPSIVSIDEEESIQPKCFFKIDDIKLYSDSEGVISKTLYLEGASCTKLETIYLQLENCSNLALRFYFKEVVIEKLMKDLIKSKGDQNRAFYNDQNIKILQPGEKYHYPIWFKSKICAQYSQTYEMILNPDLWHNKLKVLIQVDANSQKNMEDEFYRITARLENQIRSRLIKEVLQDITKKIPLKPTEIMVYTYDKATVFEAVNSIYDPMHFRPKYLYDKKVVDELEAFYEDVRLEQHPENWDYKLDTLRAVTHDREVFDKVELYEKELEDILEKIEVCKTKHKEIDDKVEGFWARDEKGKGKKGGAKSPKPKGKKSKEGSKKSKEGKDGIKGKKGKKKEKVDLIVEPVREPLPKTLSDRLEDIIEKLESPKAWRNERYERMNVAYAILCTYIDRICEEVVVLENSFNVQRMLPKSRDRYYLERMRVFDEINNEIVVENRLFSEPYVKKIDKEAPEWTKEIPLDEYTKRYNAYHGIVAIKKGSTKGKGKDKKGKKGKEKKKKGKSISEKTKTTASRVSMLTDLEEILEETEPDEEICIPDNLQKQYDDSMYLIFYTNLGKAIDDMIASFDLLPNPEIPHNILQRIHNSQYDPLKNDSMIDLRVFDLKKVISQTLKSGKMERIRSVLKLVPKEKPDLKESDSSLWSVLKAYYPKRDVLKPKTEGAMYAVPTQPFPPDTQEMSTSMTPEEVILDRNLQTSIDGDTTVEFIDDLDEEMVCICDSPRDYDEGITHLPYYDSTIGFDKESTNSSDETGSCKNQK